MLNIIAAIIILTVVASFKFILNADWNQVAFTLGFATIIIFVTVGAKKLMAFWLDADVEHEIWQFSRYGLRNHWHFKKEIPGGIIFPLFLSLFSLGYLKFTALLTFETKASKYRAAKRFGFYSFTEMTDWHNALIGGAGIVSLLIISILAYFPGGIWEQLSKLAAIYAFCNMIPISKLDGTQIFFGSRVLYAILAVITIIFLGYAFFL